MTTCHDGPPGLAASGGQRAVMAVICHGRERWGPGSASPTGSEGLDLASCHITFDEVIVVEASRL